MVSLGEGTMAYPLNGPFVLAVLCLDPQLVVR